MVPSPNYVAICQTRSCFLSNPDQKLYQYRVATCSISTRVGF